MKILWVSDPPEAPTAYGQQTALFLPRLVASGHEVALLATSSGYVRRLGDGTVVLPVAGDRHGNSVVREHARRFGADVVITLVDPHVLAPGVYAELPWCAWAPLDFETPTRATLQVLQQAKCVWSPSRHGRDAYLAAGLKNVSWVPHGVDSSVFDLQDQGPARDTLGASIGAEIPADAFLAVAVAANRGSPSRKGFYEIFAAWKEFSSKHDNVFLYLHTEVTGLGGIGEDLRSVADLAGLKTEPVRSVLFPPQYELVCGMLGPEHLAAAYGAADVFLSTAHGEGFGLGAYEAQMCGCSVILPDNTAQTEACISGQLVDVIPYMPFDGATLWGRPSVEGTVKELEYALDEKTHDGPFEAEGRRVSARGLIMPYDIDRVFTENFLPALAKAIP